MPRRSSPSSPSAETTRRTQAERRAATRAALVDAARSLFARDGFAGASTTEILELAGVSRGAMYHHFVDKADLFAAVYEVVEEQATTDIAMAAAAATDDPLRALHLAVDAYLDAAEMPDVARIVLLDAPTALGWERWKALEEQYGLGLAIAALQAGIDAGALRALPVVPLAHVLLGALRDGALLVARADDPATARPDVSATLHGLVDALAA